MSQEPNDPNTGTNEPSADDNSPTDVQPPGDVEDAGDVSSKAVDQPEQPASPAEPADVEPPTEETLIEEAEALAGETSTDETLTEDASTEVTLADQPQTGAPPVEPLPTEEPPPVEPAGEGDQPVPPVEPPAPPDNPQQQPPQQPQPQQQQPQQAASGGGGGGYPDEEWMYKPPGDSLVTGGGILLVLFFLLTLTVGLLYQITVHWPACELTQETGKDQANANTNVNANTSANTNANVNANTNVNGNSNVNGNAGTPANLSVNPPPATTTPPAPVETPKEEAAGGATKADMDSAEPKTGSIKGNTLVVIKGKDFQKDDVVKFDNKDAKRGPSSAESISVRTPPHEEGTVDITIHRGNTLMDTLRAEYTYVCPAPAGSELFLMLIMAGALGGCIHALRSLYWYTGQGTLKWRWVPMYFVLPFTGAAMAMMFSLLIVAGFVTNTTGRGESLFIIAVAGLVGMFSQQAALKLTDIANAFFTKPGEGKDANPQESLSVSAGAAKSALTATAMSINTGTAADEVTITGTGFTDATTVDFGDAAATVKKVTPTAITVTPPAKPAGTVVDVTVKLGNLSVPLPVKFTYA